MMKKIAVFNQKGGCGKTTTVFNLAGCLAKRGFHVLVIDCDPQHNITNSLHMESMDTVALEHTITDVLSETVRIKDAVYTSMIRTRGNAKPKDIGIDFIPSDRRLSSLTLNDDGDVLKRSLTELDGAYDYVLFDCPPGLSDIIINALVASDYILVPVAADKDSLDGYGELIDTVQAIVDNHINPELKILGVFMTLVNGRDSFDTYLYEQCRQLFEERFMEETIRRQSYAKRAPFFARPLCYYKPTCDVAKDYERLTDAVLEKLA